MPLLHISTALKCTYTYAQMPQFLLTHTTFLKRVLRRHSDDHHWRWGSDITVTHSHILHVYQSTHNRLFLLSCYSLSHLFLYIQFLLVTSPSSPKMYRTVHFQPIAREYSTVEKYNNQSPKL